MTDAGSAARTAQHPARARIGWAVTGLWLIAVCAVLEWPITRSGYLLAHDMVFTPHQPLAAAAIGLSSAAPRAVPLDALVALAEHVVDGAVVGRVAVLVPLLAAGLGCAAVLARCSWSARIAAATFATWNPYVVERLAIGQWALLWAYAALPWLVVALRDGRSRRSWAIRAVALAAAAITPTGALLAGATAVIVLAVQRCRRREFVGTTLLAIAVQLPWVVPALASASAGTSDPRAVAAFAPRAENGGGAVLSLLGGGGIWDADVVPASRGGAHAWVWLVLLAVAAVTGAPRLVRLLGRRLVLGFAATAGLGLLLAALPVLPGGSGFLRAVIDAVPGAGLLRDSQKWIAPLVVLEAVLAGAAVDRIVSVSRRARDTRWRGWAAVVAVAAAAIPIIALPDAPATLRVSLRPVHYPTDWARVAHILTRQPRGDVLALPFAAYRSFPWAPGRTVLDPAPRLLPSPTVVDDRLVVGHTTLRGENPIVARIAAALHDDPARLALRLTRLRIAWIVVEHRTPGPVPLLPDTWVVRSGRDVSLYRVPGRIPPGGVSTGTAVLVLTGDVIALLAVISALGYAVSGSRRRREPRATAAS